MLDQKNLYIRGSVHEFDGWGTSLLKWYGIFFYVWEHFFAVVFLGGWSEGFITVSEVVQTHCSLTAHRGTALSRTIKLKSLWMLLWLKAPDAPASSLANWCHTLWSLPSALLGVWCWWGWQSFLLLCFCNFCFLSGAPYGGEHLSVAPCILYNT